MGNNLGFTCPNCKTETFNPLKQSIEEITNHVKNCYKIKCPHCSQTATGFCTGKELVEHIQHNHDTRNLCCPVCNISTNNEKRLIEHFLEIHHTSKKLSCPICNKNTTDENDFVKHLESKHSKLYTKRDCEETVLDVELSNRLPKEGDKVIAMCGKTKWEYFNARVKRFNKDSLKYEIEWEDGGLNFKTLDYFNIAKDRAPTEKEIGIGSVVLFSQGGYEATESDEGKRWHEGVITNIYTNPDGGKCYDGCHTKTTEDGKCITYPGYSQFFIGLSREEFRIRPNVFEVTMENSQIFENEDQSSDIFFSYHVLDSFIAYKNGDLKDLIIPESYLKNYVNMCDPYEIESFLRKKGYNIANEIRKSKEDFKNISASIRKAKVFIACISDAYVLDESCVMEFQFAKTTLHKPVIPLVVGDGSFAWIMSAVGMIIAGELFIHFKDKAIQNEKCNELLLTLKKLLKTETDVTQEKNYEPADVFLSYCWKNSFKAEELKQVDQANGSKFADPRLLKDMITNLGYKVWLDIEQLSSANADSGLFGQITEGIKAAKVVIPCISDDYSKSANCRMELQFALKSLNKPIIPVVVGKGSDWRQSVVGALMSTYHDQPINLQDVYDHKKLNKAFKKVKSALDSKISKSSPYDMLKRFSPSSLKNGLYNTFCKKKNLSRTPKVGDRVICHHVKWAYYTAKVVSYNNITMKYKVDWDDNSLTQKEVMFDEIAVDVAPEINDVGVGSSIIFPQGSYTKGNNNEEKRYHEGEITSVNIIQKDLVFLNGHHCKNEDDGKWIKYDGYSYHFTDIPLSSIRLPPTALETIFSGAINLISSSVG